MPRTQTSAADLAKLLGDAIAPVYVLDEERRIVFANAACARWTGHKPGELIGQECRYASGDDVAKIGTGLCPPPKVFSGHSQMALVRCRAADGRERFRRGHFFPLADGQDDSSGVLAILELADSLPDELPPGDDDSQLHELLARFRGQMAARHQGATFLGASPAVVRARAQIALAAATSATVLIVGPRGSGKEHAAKAIHYAAPQPGTLVPLDCAVLDTSLLQFSLRTLVQKHAGSAASAGTLLVSDVDFLPPEIQAELLGLLRSKVLPMRVIATSTGPVTHRAGDAGYSAELACALSTITIELPRLAERVEDLPLLAQAFLEEVNAKGGKQVGGFTSDALDALAAYAWPGNVDELMAIVRQAHERSGGGEVTARDLPSQIHLAADAALYPARTDEPIVLEEFLAKVEKELIARAMRRAKGNKSKAAKLLGLTRPRLYRRLVQLGMVPSGEEDAGAGGSR